MNCLIRLRLRWYFDSSYIVRAYLCWWVPLSCVISYYKLVLLLQWWVALFQAARRSVSKIADPSVRLCWVLPNIRLTMFTGVGWSRLFNEVGWWSRETSLGYVSNCTWFNAAHVFVSLWIKSPWPTWFVCLVSLGTGYHEKTQHLRVANAVINSKN